MSRAPEQPKDPIRWCAALALAFAAYHSATWFNLTPKALPVQVGEEFVPGGVIAGVHYVAWAVLSLAVLWLAGAF